MDLSSSNYVSSEFEFNPVISDADAKLVAKVQDFTHTVDQFISKYQHVWSSSPGEDVFAEIKQSVSLLQQSKSPELATVSRLAAHNIDQALRALEKHQFVLLSSTIKPSDIKKTVAEIKSIRQASEALAQELQALSSFSLDNAADLGSLPQTSVINDDVSQIRVLNQYADGLSTGFENCGYHALKNALLIASSHITDKAALSKALNDPDYFQLFYKTYCLPVIESDSMDTVKRVGRRDASAVVLREIIQRILGDPNPPQVFVELKKGLQEALKKDQLTLITLHGGGQESLLAIASPDEFSLNEFIPMLQFLQQPGPRSLEILVGHSELGHWYTVVMHKDDSGDLKFLGCDSMENDQKTAGRHAPFIQIAQMFAREFKDVDQFTLKAYSSMGEQVNRLANEIEAADKKAINELVQRHMDGTPNSLLSSKVAPNGSAREILIGRCLQAFTFMNKASLWKSESYECQLHIAHLDVALKFCLKHLPAEDPAYSSIADALSILQKQRLDPKKFTNNLFEWAVNDFKALRDKIEITSFQYQQIKATFEQMQIILKNADRIAHKTSDDSRNDMINTLTNSAGAEEGFSSGGTPKEAKRLIENRVNILLLTYQKAKHAGKLLEFARKLVAGDQCLTARIGRVEDYAAVLAVGDIPDVRFDKLSELPITALSTFFGEFDAVSIINFKVEQMLLPKHKEALVRYFTQFGNNPAAIPFRRLMVEKGWVDNDDDIAWKDLISKIVELPEFQTWLKSAKADALAYL